MGKNSLMISNTCIDSSGQRWLTNGIESFECLVFFFMSFFFFVAE